MSLKVNFTISTSDINFFKKPLLYSPQSWKANPNTKPLSWQVFTDSKIIFVLGSLSQNTTILAKNAGMLWRKQSKIPRDSWYKRKWVCFCCDKWQKKKEERGQALFQPDSRWSLPWRKLNQFCWTKARPHLCFPLLFPSVVIAKKSITKHLESFLSLVIGFSWDSVILDTF